MAPHRTHNSIQTLLKQTGVSTLHRLNWWSVQKLLLRSLPNSAIKDRIVDWLARLTRNRSGATFICITGSSAKSSTAGMLSHILASEGPVHAQVLRNTFRVYRKSLRRVSLESKYAVCEIATHGPGTLQPQIDLVKPSVGIVTLVGLEHYSAFRTHDAVADEKATLVEALPQDGLAILNHDDPHVLAMKARSKARVVTFGCSGGDYRNMRVTACVPGALGLTIDHDGASFDIETQMTGAHNIVSVAAAFVCAHQLGLPASLITDRLASFRPIFGRCSTHVIDNGPIFIADTGKAPYWSIYLPIKMMGEFTAPRKRIVMGQISDAGNTNPKYRDVYRAARLVADQVIFVGDNAHRSKATAEEVAAGRFVEKRTVREAAAFIKETAIPGEIILLKSAPNLHLERIVLSFEDEVACWDVACGKRLQCVDCKRLGFKSGLSSTPARPHKAIRRRHRDSAPTLV